MGPERQRARADRGEHPDPVLSAGGVRGIKIVPDRDAYEVEKVRSTRKIQSHRVTTVREGDHVYGWTGVIGPAPGV